MPSKKTKGKLPVSQENIDQCLASVVSDGDIVNFRFLFCPYSPLRDGSTEDIASPKYQYLLPEDEENERYRAALTLAQNSEMHQHVKEQLEKTGPAQLPAPMLLMLADNAVRLGKFTSAAQAYELLRIRGRMQEEYFSQADKALDENDVPRGVHGYLIATGLEYDYAAFPEPLPAVPNFPTRALMLHAQYPHRPEDCVALQAPEAHLKTALSYLLLNPEAAARLDQQPLELRLAFVERLVRRQDPDWEAFAARYRDTCALVKAYSERFQREANRQEGVEEGLADEIEEQREDYDPGRIPAQLLGRSIEDGEWWQYLKELAYQHPASVLFVTRQAVSKDLEIIMPRYRSGSPLVARLGLEA